jgi:hypothetical protein
MTQNQNSPVVAALDPEITDRLVGDPGIFSSNALKLGALASAPLVLALAARNAFGADLPAEIVDVLKFALTLEHIEDAFYRSGLEAKGLIPAKYNDVFNNIGAHEAAHVAFLKKALGKDAFERPKLDLTAGGKYADVLTNFDTYLTLSQTFEDLGVAAYKGQAANLMSSGAILTAALQIHSVEARHAAQVRRIGGKPSWDAAFDEPKTKEEVLAAAKPFLV